MELYDPQIAGMDAKRLERIDPIMEGFVKDNQLPGIMTLVQRHGAVVHFGKYGMMDIEAGKPMQEDALFRIFSMTKPIISVALMLLYEQGLFSLTDPVSNFIPAFKKTKVYAGASVLGAQLVDQAPPMTLYHLLTHTSGLSYGWFFDSPIEEMYRQLAPSVFQRGQSLQDTIERLAELPLLFQPGTNWRYSLANDVIGYVIQVVADMPLADFLHERIFKPLGMVDTAFSVPADKLSRLAQIYTSPALYNPIPIKPEMVGLIGDVSTPTLCPSGGAGLVSTLADYLAFCNCLLDQGKNSDGILLSRKTLAWMTANHIPPSLMPLKVGLDVKDHGYGFGFWVTTSLAERRILSSVGEYGWDGAAKTYFWIDPAEDLIGLLMTQYMPMLPYPVRERFRVLAYQAIVD
ncbi:MAG: serine hydrolase domain-containing protein [Chloroflexota bacterium]